MEDSLPPFEMHPQFSYIHPFRHSDITPYPEDMKWFYWYVCRRYTIGIQFELEEMIRFFRRYTTALHCPIPTDVVCRANKAKKLSSPRRAQGEPSEFQRTYSSEDYQRTRPILEQVLKEYNEEHPIPPLDSQDPYSPDPEALMQLDNLMQMDLNSPTTGQDRPSPNSQQAAQATDQVGSSGTTNLQDFDSWPQRILPTQSHVREWWDDDLTNDDINWALDKIKDKLRKMVNKRIMGSDYSSNDFVDSGDDPTTSA
ncbi:hypothetical protein CRG98_035892 [Punica granatum]|uniref:Uncharacterized protein n=1 Tax=Punica granatum TaxID=22663 RepID=A0A2I0IIV4_PUNGR|nr:hypothetical protein CRG98_035892 [Punica granatum]